MKGASMFDLHWLFTVALCRTMYNLILLLLLLLLGQIVCCAVVGAHASTSRVETYATLWSTLNSGNCPAPSAAVCQLRGTWQV